MKKEKKWGKLLGDDGNYRFPEFIRFSIPGNKDIVLLKSTNYKLTMLMTKKEIKKLNGKEVIKSGTRNKK